MFIECEPRVFQAEQILTAASPDKEYLPITGLSDFTKLAAKLAYGADSAPLNNDAVSLRRLASSLLELTCYQIAITQSISGTGALRIGGEFLAKHYPHSKVIYLPVPSWGNHTPIFKDSGLEVRGYRYFDKKTVGLDFAGLKEDLQVRFRNRNHVEFCAC